MKMRKNNVELAMVHKLTNGEASIPTRKQKLWEEYLRATSENRVLHQNKVITLEQLEMLNRPYLRMYAEGMSRITGVVVTLDLSAKRW
jgi:hypothetical protein